MFVLFLFHSFDFALIARNLNDLLNKYNEKKVMTQPFYCRNDGVSVGRECGNNESVRCSFGVCTHICIRFGLFVPFAACVCVCLCVVAFLV